MKYMEEAKINVSKEVSKTIAETICKEIASSREKNKDIYDRAQRNERAYNQVSRWAAQNKVPQQPWPGAADYFIPLTEWTIDAVWARAINTLFAQEPYMTAEAVESSDVEKAPGVTDFVDMVFREIIYLQKNFSFYLKQMLKIPFAVVKYCWVQDFERVIAREEAQVLVKGDKKEYIIDDEESMMKAMNFIANGYVPQQEREAVWVAVDKELNNSPKLEYIKFADYVWCPGAKKGKKPYWEGDRFWLTVNDLVVKGQQGVFDKDSSKSVKNQLNLNEKNNSSAILAERETLIEAYNWYGRLPFNSNNEIDFEDNDAIEQEVHCIVSYHQNELLSINHWEYGRLPKEFRVYIRGMYEETENFDGRSLVDKIYQSQKELNSLHNTIMNNAQIAMQKIFVKKHSLTGDEWDNPEIFPGAIWEEGTPGDIRVLEVGDVKSISWELEQSFINFAERLSNVSIYQTGTARTEGGAKTKGEVDATIYEGNIGIDKFINRCHDILRTICKWTVDYYQERMPPGLERRIRGEDGELIWPEHNNLQIYEGQGVNPYWSSDDVAGKYDFVWKGTTLNSSKKWQIQVANDMMERYLPHPMISGNLMATWEILRDGLIARGIKDWKKYLPPKEAILSEMQMNEKRAQNEKILEQGQQQIPMKAAQMAQQMGVPPQIAQQLSSQAQGGMNAV